MLDELHQEGTDRVLDDLARRPGPVPRPEPRFGLLSAPKAMGSAAAAFGAERTGFFADVVGAFGESLATTEASAGGMFALQSPRERSESIQAADKIAGEGLSFSSDAGDLFRNVGRSYRADPVTAHMAERVIFDLTRGLLKVGTDVLTMGPAGALLSAADEASMVADDLKQQGVDLGARTAVGTVAGVGLGVGAVLPMAGSTVAKTAALYALGGPVGFMAQQQATRSILQAADYSSISMQYDPLDPVGLAVSSLIPLPFAAYGLRRARAKVTPEQVDAARVAHVVQEQQAHSLVEPGNLKGQAAEARAIEAAEAQIARGERVNVAALVEPEPTVRVPTIETPEFKAWFGESKVVDGLGAPMVVYHGTRADVPAFDIKAPRAIQADSEAEGFYFTRHAEDAGNYAGRQGGEGGNVVPVYVAMQNPLVWPADDLAPARITTDQKAKIEAAGHDGVIYRGGDEVVAFRPEQIKSAIGNSGRFDPKSASLTDPLTEFAGRLAAGVRASEREAKAMGLTGATKAPALREAGTEASPVPPKPAADGDSAPATPGAKAETSAAKSRLAEVEREFPDLEVMMDGMDKPMKLSDFLAAVKAEADEELADAPLYQLAAECALLNGIS